MDFKRAITQLALTIFMAGGLWMHAATGEEIGTRDTMPDTWVATDHLGRTLPSHEDVGTLRDDRAVAIFYHTWHGVHSTSGPHDTTKILEQYPNALSDSDHPAWGPANHFHHWGEPILDYYVSTDEWVYKKHAQMLSDVGVDVVVFDATNQHAYEEQTMALCRAFDTVRKNGGNTPQIAFMTPFFSSNKVVNDIYNYLYGPGLYKDLWFMLDGKPLVLANPDSVDSEELLDFFTFRRTQPSYFAGPTWSNYEGEVKDMWCWLEVFPQHIYYNSAGEKEMMGVGIAQNAAGNRLCAFSEPGVRGRSWHGGQKDMSENAVAYGLNVQEQWDRALEEDPKMIYVSGWNEWTAMRMNSFNNVNLPVMFVDMFSQEYSRDAEPMVGGHGDAYYLQLADNIRRFKGIRSKPEATPMNSIDVEGDFSQWDTIPAHYLDDIGDVYHRDHHGLGETHYTNFTGRNDFVEMKVTHDEQNVYFYAQTATDITTHTDQHWMMLFLNTDGAADTGWHGYNYVVNRVVRDANTGLLESFGDLPGTKYHDWVWKPAASVKMKVEGNQMMVVLPKWALRLSDNDAFTIDFKWVDNFMAQPYAEAEALGRDQVEVEPDILDFYVSGDAAPNGRFNYRFQVK